MPRSSLQTLLFWDCLLSLFTVYLLAQSSEKVVSRNVTFLSYHNVLGENVRYKLEAITSVNQECVFNLANHLKNESLGPYSFRPQINHTLLIEKYKLESYNVKAICIRVTPFKDNCTECHNLTQILGNIEINPYGDSDCLNFNMSCGFRPQDYNEFGHHRLFKCDYNKNNRKRVQICSKTIVVQLFELFDDFTTCNFKPHSKYGEVGGSQVLSVENAQFMFKNLTPGYYCYHVQPLGCNSDCGFFSKVYHLREDMLVPLKLLPQPRPKMESTQIAYIVCAVISGVFVVGLIIGLIIRRRLRNAPSDLQSPNKNMFIPLNEVILEDKPLKRREITILYTQETPEILNCISKLVEFLRKCCDVVIRFDMDDEVNVRKNPVAWYGRGDVFILVETEGAVYREQCCLDGKEIHHVNEDSLDSYFIHSFMRIINNPNSIIDYSKYVVLRFSYTPKRVSFKTVALSKRYVISQHLAHLCHFLTYGKDLTPTTENLLKFFNKWENTLEYSNLDIAIKNAKYFVHANPDYVTQVFKSRN